MVNSDEVKNFLLGELRRTGNEEGLRGFEHAKDIALHTEDFTVVRFSHGLIVMVRMSTLSRLESFSIFLEHIQIKAFSFFFRDNALLTPTFKLKRHQAKQRFAAEIHTMYDKPIQSKL